MRRALLLLLSVLLATPAAAAVKVYVYEHTESRPPSTPIPQFFVADLETELTTAPNPHEGDTAYAKDSDKFLKRTGSAWVEVGGGGGGAHNLLSATHTDSAAAAVTRGDIVVGNSTPAWSDLAIGVNNRVLFSNGTDPSWSTVPDAALASNYSGVGTCTNQFARVLNDNAAPTCDTVQTADVAGDAITYAKMQNVSATDRFLGRKTSGAGDPEELTGTEATARLDVFTSVLKGLAPASGGGTANYLRADGTWAAPPGTTDAPTGARYWVGVADATLTNEMSLGAQATGLVLSTNSGGTGFPSAYTGTTCTNSFVRQLDGSGVALCQSVNLGNADVTNVLTFDKGGTGQSTAPADNVLVGSGSGWQLKTLPSCSTGATDKLLYNSTTDTFSCGTDQTGGGGSGNSVEKSVALTSDGMTFTATVTGQSWVTTSSVIVCSVLGTTADSLTPETIAAAGLTVTVSNRVASTGFDVTVQNTNGLDGTVRVHCLGV